MSSEISSDAWIRAENLHRGYSVGKKRVEVLHGIDLEIRRGEKIFLCGPSGAGKTTLMYILAGLESPEKGSVYIDGVDLYAQSRKRQAVIRNQAMSYIFQNYYLMRAEWWRTAESCYCTGSGELTADHFCR